MKTLLLKSPSMIFLRQLAILESGTSMVVCYLAPVTEYGVFRSAVNFADSISLIHIVASTGRLAHEGTSLLRFIRQILKFQARLRTQVFQLLSFWESVCLSLFTSSGSSTRTLEVCVAVLVFPAHAVFFELLRCTRKRSPTATHELGSTLFIKVVYPNFYHQWQQIQAVCLPFAPTPALGRDIISYRALWAASSVDFLLQSKELLPAEHSTFVFRHHYSQLKNFGNLRFKRKNHALTR